MSDVMTDALKTLLAKSDAYRDTHPRPMPPPDRYPSKPGPKPRARRPSKQCARPGCHNLTGKKGIKYCSPRCAQKDISARRALGGEESKILRAHDYEW